jgi:hypothetical protein
MMEFPATTDTREEFQMSICQLITSTCRSIFDLIPNLQDSQRDGSSEEATISSFLIFLSSELSSDELVILCAPVMEFNQFVALLSPVQGLQFSPPSHKPSTTANPWVSDSKSVDLYARIRGFLALEKFISESYDVKEAPLTRYIVEALPTLRLPYRCFPSLEEACPGIERDYLEARNPFKSFGFNLPLFESLGRDFVLTQLSTASDSVKGPSTDSEERDTPFAARIDSSSYSSSFSSSFGILPKLAIASPVGAGRDTAARRLSKPRSLFMDSQEDIEVQSVSSIEFSPTATADKRSPSLANVRASPVGRHKVEVSLPPAARSPLVSTPLRPLCRPLPSLGTATSSNGGVREERAARKIAKWWKYFLPRRRLLIRMDLRRWTRSLVLQVLSDAYRICISKQQTRRKLLQNGSAVVIQRTFRSCAFHQPSSSSPSSSSSSFAAAPPIEQVSFFVDKAAVKIQSIARRRLTVSRLSRLNARKRYLKSRLVVFLCVAVLKWRRNKKKMRIAAATNIQKLMRGYLSRKATYEYIKGGILVGEVSAYVL